MPALPLDEAGKYVAAAYLVFLALLIIYVAIMGMKISRIEREVGELLDLSDGPKVVKPTQDGEQSHQTARQDASPEVTHSSGSGA